MDGHKTLYKSLQSKLGNLKVKLREELNDQQKERRYELFCGRRTIFKVWENLDEVSDEQIKEASVKLRNMKEDRTRLLKLLINGFSHGTDKIQAYIECDPSLTCLVGLLLGSDAEVILLSAWCLTNMATGNDKQVSIIIKNASPYLITLLSSHAPAIQDQCAWALGNLASSSLRDELLIQGVLTPLVLLLRSPLKNVIRSASFAISNMMRSEIAKKDLLIVARVVDEMMNILSNVNEDEEILSECLWTLSLLVPNFEFGDNTKVRKFVDKLLKLLCHHSQAENLNIQMLTPLVRILGNVCFQWLSNLDVVETFETTEFLKAIERVLNSKIHHLQKETIWMLSNLSAHCHFASAMMDYGIDETISLLFDSDTYREGMHKGEIGSDTEKMDFESFKI